jgi:hypothetical protein
MSERPNIYIVENNSTKKYRKICKQIYTKYRNRFIKHENEKLSLDVPYLLSILVEHLKPTKNSYYRRNIKYTDLDFINGIIDIINNGTYWNRYKGTVPGKYLNKKHNEYCNMGVYDCLYRVILKVYFCKSKYNKLKYQTVDTTFIRNLYGSEMLQRNVQYKSKNGIKVSAIDDVNGVPIALAIGAGAKNDAKIAIEQINNTFIDTDTKRVCKSNKYKQNMYADAQYDSEEFIQTYQNNGYKVTTDVNIRNTKDEDKLKILKKRKKIYLKTQNKRIVVERGFAWLHKYPKLNRFVEKTVKSFSGLLLLACSFIVSNKLD